MVFPVAAAIGAIGAIGSAFLQNRGQNRANELTQASAREEMAFQERMSSTAYQRAALDKSAAGINPIYGLGGGSSTPGGAMSQFSNEMQGAASSAMDMLRMRYEIENMKAANEKIRSDVSVNEVSKALMQKDMQVKQATAKQIYTNIDRGSFDAAVNSAKSDVFNAVKNFFTGKHSSFTLPHRSMPAHGVAGKGRN